MSKRDRQFSQLPYVQRVAIRKASQIQAEREDAALNAVKVFLVTLADVHGYGLKRLAEVAGPCEKNLIEFYSDRERMEYHLDRRLEEIGFVIERGKIMVMMDENGNPVKASAVQDEGEAHGS